MGEVILRLGRIEFDAAVFGRDAAQVDGELKEGQTIDFIRPPSIRFG